MERLWTGSFVLMILGTFFLFTAFYMLYPTLPLFIKHIGGNETYVGLSMGIFMISAVAFRPVIGGLLDRFGRRPFIILGLFLFIFAMYMYNWTTGISFLMWLRVLHGISWAISTTTILTVISDIVPPTRFGEGIGWFSTAMTLAMAVGPILGTQIVKNLSYNSMFLFAVILSIIALLLKLGVKITFQPKSNIKRIEVFDKSVLSTAVSVFFLFISYASITTFVPLFADSLKTDSGLFFLVFSGTLFLSRPIGGKLSDQYGKTIVIVPALLISILSLIILSFSNGLTGILISAGLYGIGFGSAQPVLQATIIHLVSPERRGVANASFSTATDLGIGLGSVILGSISKYGDYRILFITSAICITLSLIVFIFSMKHSLKSRALF